MTDEAIFSRPINSDPVKFSTRTVPEGRVSLNAWLDASNFDAAGNQQRSLSSMTAAVR